MLVSLIGLCNMLFGWPLLILFHLSGMETLSIVLMPVSSLLLKIHVISYFFYASFFGLSKSNLNIDNKNNM